jgi:hypothetical protein
MRVLNIQYLGHSADIFRHYSPNTRQHLAWQHRVLSQYGRSM